MARPMRGLAIKADPAYAAPSYHVLQTITTFVRHGVIEGSRFEHLLKLIRDQGGMQYTADVSRF